MVYPLEVSGEIGPAEAGLGVDNAYLIWNALEACDKDKRKTSHTVVIRADYYDKHHYMFEVEDNADGMDEKTRENLFNEFF